MFGGDGFDDGSEASRKLLNDLWSWNGKEWTWEAGRNTGNAVGVYGVKGEVSSTNVVPGSRKGAVSWVDSSGDLWLFGGFGYDNGTNSNPGYLNDLWRWDGKKWIWESGSETLVNSGKYGPMGVADMANAPGGRENSSVWLDSNGQVWIFGGHGTDDGTIGVGPLNDLWRWDGTNWIWESGNTKANVQSNFGQIGVSNKSNILGARSNAVSWVHGDNFYLFGGITDTGGFIRTEYRLNDLWRLTRN